MLEQKTVLVDVETTGGNATRDRITEIAILKMQDGKLVSEWSTLIDPEISIPGYIQSLTGITNDMVRTYPTFSQIGDEILARLSDAVFVAHNARFDYGFLKNEFRRCSIQYRASVLCTVKLSRVLFPEYKRHNLDCLMQRHQLTCDARHRALGDARVLFDFLMHLFASKRKEQVEAAIKQLLKRPGLPAGLEQDVLDEIPQGPGVYRFLGENDVLLYIGKSINMRDRVLSHFSGDHANNRDMKISQEIRSIEVTETAGELGALLLEAQQIKALLPVYNRRLCRYDSLNTICWDKDAPTAVPVIIATTDIEVHDIAHYYGLFRTRRAAENRLRQLVRDHGLCEKLSGLQTGKGACFAYHIKRCHGACVGEEPHMQHRIRLLQALHKLKNKAWPFAGRIGIREISPDRQQIDVYLFDHWCYLGTVHTEADLDQLDLLDSQRMQFDIDTYKILQRYFSTDRNADIIPLD